MKNKCGFNLLAMSAIILVLGVVMSASLGFYNITNIKKRVFITRERFDNIDSAIKKYVMKYGKFPCPAPLNCNSTTCVNSLNNLGIENRDSNGNCTYDNSAIFSSSNKKSEIILYGGIPTFTLGITNDNIIDAWGNKIVYVVFKELTINNAFAEMTKEKLENNSKEYIQDGLIYLLMSFSKNTNGAFSYNNKNSNYFTGNENMPTSNFTINIENSKFLYFSNYFNKFEIKGLENELLECPEIEIENLFPSLSQENYTIDSPNTTSLTFKKAKYGEIIFSNESCPNFVKSPPQSNNFYYLSNYEDEANNVIENRAAKKCLANGKWKSGFLYECIKLPKCSQPSSFNTTKNWGAINFDVVNTGKVKDVNRTIEIQCIVENGVAKWYEVK